MGSYHLGTLLMDDRYYKFKDCINKDGKLYRYDPEYDCWYRVFSREEYHNLPHWDKYGWLYCIAVLTAICFYVEYIH
jgi:hypothetical protein